MCRTRKLALARPRLRMYSAASRAECSWREDIVEEGKVELGVLGGRVGAERVQREVTKEWKLTILFLVNSRENKQTSISWLLRAPLAVQIIKLMMQEHVEY
jgi:hypothetical protein